MQQNPAPQQPLSPSHTTSPTANTTRPNRLLYRRGLPDLPELIETEDDSVTSADDISMNIFSRRHSTSTSMSSREFPPPGTSGASLIAAPPKIAILANTRHTEPSHEICTQEPLGGVKQSQTPLERVPSMSQQLNPLLREEVSSPPSPVPRNEALVTAETGYGLGVSLTTSGNFHEISGSGMEEAKNHESGIGPDVYGGDEHLLEECPECSGRLGSSHHDCRSFGPCYYPSSVGVNSSEAGGYMSPLSSPGTDCTIEAEGGTNS
jgi:hypothetical protein